MLTREVTCTVSELQLEPHAALAALNRRGAGALVTFVGYCRDEDADVTALELQHYPGFTERVIDAHAREVAGNFSLIGLIVSHRVGVVSPGEAIVVVGATAKHRDAAFAAVEAMMDFLKTDAPLWKREHRRNGAIWIEPSAKDHKRRARWS